ncbi:MAG: hypothetical protein ACKVS5_05900 [Parvularculaceae bacterium]
MTATKAWQAIFVLLVIFVTWQTLTPDPDDTEQGIAIARWIAALLFRAPEQADKIAHFLAYAALGGSAALGDLRVIGLRSPVIAMLATYGLALEGLQGLGGVRAPEIADGVANALGVIAAFAAVAVAEQVARQWRPA